MIEQSTGVFIAVSRYASATPLPPAILSRGIGWQVTTTTSFFFYFIPLWTYNLQITRLSELSIYAQQNSWNGTNTCVMCFASGVSVIR